MATLAGKYGPGSEVSAEDAARRLEAYARVARAALEARGGPLRAPAQRLSDEQLAALFSRQQLAALVGGPLDRPARDCAPRR